MDETVIKYGKLLRWHPKQLPVVELGCKPYKHEKYGIVKNPTLNIVDWVPESEFNSSELGGGGETPTQDDYAQDLARETMF